MAQNKSSAVMQQRKEPIDGLDDFPTPPWAARAMCELIQGRLGVDLSRMTCAEPSANRGYMVRGLQDYFREVRPSDVADYGVGYPVIDYLSDDAPAPVDFTITNPPFKLAQAFIEQALNVSRVGVAIFVRAAFMEGEARYRSLYKVSPPTCFAPFAERVVIHRGVMRDPTKKYWNEAAQAMRAPSTATAYACLVWLQGDVRLQSQFLHIPPSRRRLERPGDYEPRGLSAPIMPGAEGLTV